MTTADENRISPSLRKDVLGQQPQTFRLNTDVAYDATPLFMWFLIASALADGFNKELIDAGQRLILIDKDTSRAYTAMGVIYLKNNQLNEAEQTLLKGINVCSAKVYLKTNLAKV